MNTLRDSKQLAKHRAGYLARLACDHPSHRPGVQVNQTTILSCVVLSGLVRGMNDLIWVLSAPVHAKEVAARVAWERRGDDATTAALLRATGAAEDVWDEDDEEVTCCG